MLQLHILTSSTNMIPISDFKYLYDLARCSKCQVFVLLQATNSLYGFSDDCCCIHQIQVPFQVNTDLVFRLDMMDKIVLEKYNSFFVPDKFNWVIIPDVYWDMYIGGDLVAEYDDYQEQYIIKDKTTTLPIDQFQMYKTLPVNDFMYKNVIDQLYRFLSRHSTLMQPITFQSVQNDQTIRKIYDNKASMGRSLVHLKNSFADVALYMYKGLFTLNKADELDIDIRFDSYDRNTFMATFKPKRKKNPMILNTYGVPFREEIHCMFMNII